MSIEAGRAFVTVFINDQTRGHLQKLSGRMRNFARTVARVGAGLSTAGGVLAVRGIVAATKEYSKLEETMNRINILFGDGRREAIAWAEEFGATAGRARADLLGMASQFRAIVPKDIPVDQANRMSMAMAQLAVDAGSFFDIADEEAFMRIRSGFLGEIKAIDNLGVTLRKEKIGARLAKDFGETTSSATEAQRAMSRFNEIMAQTVEVQGDAERTAANLANTWKRMAAQARELGVAVGEEVAPEMRALMEAARVSMGGEQRMTENEVMEAKFSFREKMYRGLRMLAFTNAAKEDLDATISVFENSRQIARDRIKLQQKRDAAIQKRLADETERRANAALPLDFLPTRGPGGRIPASVRMREVLQSGRQSQVDALLASEAYQSTVFYSGLRQAARNVPSLTRRFGGRLLEGVDLGTPGARINARENAKEFGKRLIDFRPWLGMGFKTVEGLVRAQANVEQVTRETLGATFGAAGAAAGRLPGRVVLNQQMREEKKQTGVLEEIADNTRDLRLQWGL